MQTIKILQWNVLYQEKIENIIKLVQEINPDIFCGQELTAHGAANPGVDVSAEIAKTCNYSYFSKSANVNFEGFEENFDFGDGIFSRYPVKSSREYKIQNKEEYGEDRFYLEADILIGDNVLAIGTVHLSFSPRFEITEKRLAEAKKLYEAVQGHHEKFVLAGDMNATPDSSIIKKLEEMFIHADPNTDRPTWTTKPFSYQGFEANSLDWRLDYVFATEDINVVNNKIIETNYSDHLPILAEVQI
jgi:endonuclease/exonuclease/phosphatase family metal-dependent hydrolase